MTVTMPMRIQCIQHVPFEGPAAIEMWAALRGHELTCSPAAALSPTDDDLPFDMLVSLGGPMSANDETTHPWIQSELRLMESALHAKKPILGICLGAQLLARAAGGEVGPAVDPEFGWFDVDVVPESENHWGLPTRFTPLHWHSETFSIPPNATRLAETRALANQAFSLENALGFQFHLEVTAASVQALVNASRGDLETPGLLVQKESELVGSPRAKTFEDLNEIAFAVLDKLADSTPRR